MAGQSSTSPINVHVCKTGPAAARTVFSWSSLVLCSESCDSAWRCQRAAGGQVQAQLSTYGREHAGSPQQAAREPPCSAHPLERRLAGLAAVCCLAQLVLSSQQLLADLGELRLLARESRAGLGGLGLHRRQLRVAGRPLLLRRRQLVARAGQQRLRACGRQVVVMDSPCSTRACCRCYCRRCCRRGCGSP